MRYADPASDTRFMLSGAVFGLLVGARWASGSPACWGYAREAITTSVIERFEVDWVESTTKRR